jgi:UTP-glucose-1-phosphate uridylyltransferase
MNIWRNIKMSENNNKHDSGLKYIQQLLGQLLKDLELVIQEIEKDSYDTGYKIGYAKCERDNGLTRRDVPEDRKVL